MFRCLHTAMALAVALWAGHALAASDKPLFGPPAAWVEVGAIPPAPPADGAAAVQVLLDDNQSRLGPEGDAYYNRRTYKILKTEGLTAFKTLGSTWSPDTETVTFHRMAIVRDGKTIDLLKRGKDMLVLRRETNLERAMLDGRMTASRQIEGLQVGDILDFEWTTTRKDPVVQGRSYDMEALTFAGVAGRYRVRLNWAQGAPVRWKATEGFGEPQVFDAGGRTWLVLDVPNAKAPKPPVGAPLRFRRLGLLETSSFADWREVSQMMAPHYARTAVLKADSPLKAEAAAIAAASPDPKARAFAALQLVEDKTRYLFLGMGDGGYVPASADETWSRKFGDCKGKTVLLLALLKELGIEAEPALVNLGGGDGLDARPPSLAAFNHVIVRAVIGGKVYWLDGTRTGDKGGLDALKPPSHHWALPVRPAGADLERIVVPPLDAPQMDVAIRLDASKGLKERAPARLTTRLTGDMANAIRQGLARAPKEDVERAMRQQASGGMNWLELEDVTWRDLPDQDAFEIVLTGLADMDWRVNPDVGVLEYKVAAAPTRPSGFPRREPGPNRDAPFVIAFPFYVRSVFEIVLPAAGAGYSVRGPNDTQVVAGQELKRTSRLEQGVARFAVDMRALTPEISTEEAEAANRVLRQLSGEDSLVRAPR